MLAELVEDYKSHKSPGPAVATDDPSIQDLTDELGKMQLDVELDILGQQPLLKIYTQICLCYPLADESFHSTIIDRITKGLELLTKSFPWIAGKVINEGASEGNSGVFKIIPFEKIPRLVVKDLRKNAWTWEAMKKANFPFSMLDESIVCPRNTLPGFSNETEEQRTVAPVFYVQITFITGGVILAFVAHHGTMDMTGQGHMINLLSKACKNEPFTDEELSTGNAERRSIVPFLEESWKPGSELDHQITRPPPTELLDDPDNSPVEKSSHPHSSWAYFSFSPESLSIMKTVASTSLTDVEFVSTDDTVTAFIWQSTMRARLPRLDPSANVSFARAVDVRRYLGISPDYPGLTQNMTYHSSSLQELVDGSLGAIASQFRLAVDTKRSTLAHDTRALATLMHRAEDKSKISITAALDLASDIMLSSWAKVNSYALDFGLSLGTPEAVRRPQFTPVESLMYLMPKRSDGEYVAGLCLRDEDMDRLKADEEFTKYAVYIG
jgi:hypothetical protein